MAEDFDTKYLDLLRSEKNHSTAFGINIAELLQSFIIGFKNGDVPCDFKSAALVIQAGCSVYGKKVEHLHSMATSLYAILLQNETKKGDGDPNKVKRAAKKEKTFDPLCSIEITPGKNLSCLTRYNAVPKKSDASKKAQKKAPFKLHSFVPVDLLPLESEEKGDIFYDTNGEPVGYKGDYALNTMKVTASGWMLLNTLSPELIDIVDDDSDDYIAKKGDCDERDSSDEGDNSDGDYPPSSGFPCSVSTTPNSQESDEGTLQSTPSEDPASVGIEVISVEMENFSMDDLPAVENSDARPMRKSMRQALAMKQLDPEEETLKKKTKSGDEYVAVKAPIEKKNTVSLPLKLRDGNQEIPPLEPAAEFCNREFFESDKTKKSDHFSLLVPGFENNSKFNKLVIKMREAAKVGKCKIKKKGGDNDEDENVENDEIEEEGCDALKEADDDGEPANPGLEFDDFEINKSPAHSIVGDENPMSDEVAAGDMSSMDGEAPQETEPFFDFVTEFRLITEKELTEFRGNVSQNFQPAKVREKVRIWQKALGPFLDDIKTREKFDINECGSDILNAFENSNRRQTKSFRAICQGKEKWEIHRLFMALLPLANNGNIELANGLREDGEEDGEIMVTLLSRKMHHLEVEEFGHNSGEH